MRSRSRWVAFIAVASLACKPRANNPSGGGSSPTVAEAPEAVARRYLELGARGDLDAVQALVVADCRRGPVGDVDAVKVMGGRMTLRSAETSVESLQGDDARVRYSVAGPVHSDGGTTTMFGAQVHVGAVHVDNAQQSGSLHMVRQGGRWLVTCH